MLTIRFSSKFKKDFKKVKKQSDSGYNENEFKKVLQDLQNGKPLDEKFLDHPLQGEYKGCRECHLKPDLLLIYEIHDNILELLLLRIGSHSDLFKK